MYRRRGRLVAAAPAREVVVQRSGYVAPEARLAAARQPAHNDDYTRLALAPRSNRNAAGVRGRHGRSAHIAAGTAHMAFGAAAGPCCDVASHCSRHGRQCRVNGGSCAPSWRCCCCGPSLCTAKLGLDVCLVARRQHTGSR